MNYSQSMEYMENINTLGSVPGLDSIRELCRRLGNPQDSLRFVHIAGTNGKGSTLAYLSTVLTTAGYRTGRYVSPAVTEYREHFQIDGRMISKQAFAKYLSQAAQAAEEMAQEGMMHPTAFEIETAVSFLFFAEKKCDIVVLETGMGGLLDATNLITTTLVSVFASISMDHMQFLGKTLSEIAMQKAGIIKQGCAVVSVRQQPEVMEVLERTCRAKDTELIIADASQVREVSDCLDRQTFSYEEYRNLSIRLPGIWQIENAVLAVCVLKVLGKMGFPVTQKQLKDGLRKTEWFGRFSVIEKQPLFIVDGAHNADASAKLAESIKHYFPDKRRIFILGVLRDKEYTKIIQNTVLLADQVIGVATPGNPRAMAAYDLAKEIKEYQANVTAADSLEEAVEMAHLLADPDTVIVAFGSLSYLGRLKEIVEQKSKRHQER